MVKYKYKKRRVKNLIIELEENIRTLSLLQQKLNEIGESL